MCPRWGWILKQAGELVRTLRGPQKENENLQGPEEAVLSLLDEATRKGLPFQEKSRCQLDESSAKSLEKFSGMLHAKKRDVDRFVQMSASSASASSAELDPKFSTLAYALEHGSQWKAKEAVPALVQILEAEPAPVRGQLVKMLAAHPGPETTRALVDRAVYDVSLQVRYSANAVLLNRPPAESRQRLLEALRYPWDPVAWHAAETLVLLKDEKAVPALIKLLDAPDPAQPFADVSGQMVVRELVRVNHMRNCLLCHAPSRKNSDLVSAPVPVPNRRPFAAYYGKRRFSGLVLVRADVTYLRQDFSHVHHVKDANPWPEEQRFDYFVRTRPATPEETAALKDQPPAERTNYPQRQAVLTALRKLTGRDLGTSSTNWRRLNL